MVKIRALFVMCAVSLQVQGQWVQPSPPSGPIYYNGGYVGVGTAQPSHRLTVAGDMLISNTGSTRLFAQYVGTGNGSDITGMMGGSQTFSIGFNSEASYGGTRGTLSGRMLSFYDRVSGVSRGAIDGTGTWWLGSSPTNFALSAAAPSGSASGIGIDATGRVGIGTTAPAFKLDVRGAARVTGDLTVDGNFATKFQDVAEWVPARSELRPGNVVIVAPGEMNSVVASRDPYDTRVAGVVSARPGIILGEGGPEKVMVATTGRVKVKVVAGSSPIEAGDLLVTSAIAGVAMKSEPIVIGGVQMHRPGTLVGKALEPLRSGTGEILVLLSLQ